jgi:hypothetical protein
MAMINTFIEEFSLRKSYGAVSISGSGNYGTVH